MTGFAVPDSLVVRLSWLSSWLLWPRQSVPPDVLDEAADWAASSLFCACSREWFAGLGPAERRGVVVLVADIVRPALGRAVPAGAGKSVMLLPQLCLGSGRPCGRARVVRVEVL